MQEIYRHSGPFEECHLTVLTVLENINELLNYGQMRI